MAQDFKVIGKRNENDKLSGITLTRSVVLNDLTQEQLKRLYRRGVALNTDFFNGFKLVYKCIYRDGSIVLTVERVHFDQTNQTMVMECGYSLDKDKYFKVLLNQDANGNYDLSPRILNTEWLKESDLKTINGESIVGTGDIEIKGGSDGNVITIIYGKEDRNIEAYKLLYNYTGANNNAVSVNLQYSLWLYAATNIWTSVSEKRIYFDIFLLGNLSKRQLSYSRFYLTEDGTCSMESNALLSVPTLMGEDVSDIRLKSINGESIVGDGDITVGGGSTAAYVYFRLSDTQVEDWQDNLSECGIDMETFLNNIDILSAPISCYCKVQINGAQQLLPFSILHDTNTGMWHIYFTVFNPYNSLIRRFDVSAYNFDELKNTTSINWTDIQ